LIFFLLRPVLEVKSTTSIFTSFSLSSIITSTLSNIVISYSLLVVILLSSGSSSKFKVFDNGGKDITGVTV